MAQLNMTTAMYCLNVSDGLTTMPDLFTRLCEKTLTFQACDWLMAPAYGIDKPRMPIHVSIHLRSNKVVCHSTE